MARWGEGERGRGGEEVVVLNACGKAQFGLSFWE